MSRQPVTREELTEISLDSLFKATAAYYYMKETGKLLGEGREPTTLEAHEVGSRLFLALADVRLNHRPKGLMQ